MLGSPDKGFTEAIMKMLVQFQEHLKHFNKMKRLLDSDGDFERADAINKHKINRGRKIKKE